MDQLYNLLFNPSHTMSLPVLIAIPVLVLGTSFLTQYYARWKQTRRGADKQKKRK